MLLIVGERVSIPMDDETLDRVRDMLEECPPKGSGFWISGHLDRKSRTNRLTPTPRLDTSGSGYTPVSRCS